MPGKQCAERERCTVSHLEPCVLISLPQPSSLPANLQAAGAAGKGAPKIEFRHPCSGTAAEGERPAGEERGEIDR